MGRAKEPDVRGLELLLIDGYWVKVPTESNMKRNSRGHTVEVKENLHAR
jgi:hypothetical protein